MGNERAAVTIANTGITLALDGEMHLRLSAPDGTSIVAGGWAEVESGGQLVDRFALEPDTPPPEPLANDLGQGQRYTVSGVADLPGGQLRRTLTVDVYPQWPEALILRTHYENLSARPLTLTRIADPLLQLDSSLTDPALAATEMWSFQGPAVGWGQDFAFPLSSAVSVRDNYLGHLEGAEGGGIPLLYFWNRQLGVALAHVEPLPQLWYMPVQSGPRHGVRAALENRQPVVIQPGGRFSGPRTLLSFHHGDLYDPLALYADVLAAQGLRPAQPVAEDYEPTWCSWGYEFDVRPSEMLGVVPKLHELGIHWATLDDRWFDAYGDWNPRADTFPGGEEEMRALVDALHDAGIYAQIWWYPLAVEDGVGGYDAQRYTVAEVLQEHPDWLCRNADGSVARNNRGLAILDPAIPGVQQYVVELTRRFIADWGFDGHKLDNIYTVPPCYGSVYHTRPEESVEAFAEVYRLIHETTRALKPNSVTQICPCGTPPTFSLLPYYDQAVTADPTSSAQVRQRIKFYKALLGPQAAVFADHVELSDGGSDFASAIGAGGIPGTKFVWPEDDTVRQRVREWQGLDAEKEALEQKWFSLYNQYRLSAGEYLNLYDLAYDAPEGHVIRKGERLYYAFYTPQASGHFAGVVELRGLEERVYRLSDYVHGADLGVVRGPTASVRVAFDGSVLLEASPE
jgi:alpha-galactosidase